MQWSFMQGEGYGSSPQWWDTKAVYKVIEYASFIILFFLAGHDMV